MKRRFIIGRAGAGKTTYCLDEIAENIAAGWDKPLLLLVPNQFSLEMEKNLVLKTEGRGMDIAQVLSFERLSYRVFSLYGKPKEKILDDVGRAALLRRILYTHADTLTLYGSAYNKDGFIRQLGGIFSEFHKYGIQPQELSRLADSKELGGSLLPLKLADLSLIFGEYTAFMENQYICAEQNLDLLAEMLEDATAFRGCKIWIDGFYRFTAQDYHVIEKLAGIAEELSISLTMHEHTNLTASIHPYDPFFETKMAARRIFDILGAQEAPPEVVRLKKQEAFGYGAAVQHLEQEYFNFAPKPFAQNQNHVRITQSGQIYDELQDVGAKIVHLVRDLGYRYRDIAVCACDLQSYEHLLTEMMAGHEIPYFVDSRKTIYYKRLVEVIRGLIQVGTSNWSGESVIRLLRTGVFGFASSEVDALENYLLEFGIKGYKWRQEAWHYCGSFDAQRDERMNGIKQRVEEIPAEFLALFAGKAKPTVKAASAGIFSFIEKNEVLNQLLLLEENQRETVQVWNILVALFEKLVEIMGDEAVDIKLFGQIVEGALESAAEGFIPAKADAVLLGDIKRTRLPQIRALFVLGMNDGVIPSQKGDEGILTDADRLLLADAAVELAPTGVRQVIEEQFLLYAALTKPKERLYLSYPTMGLAEEELRKSILIEKIEQIFPHCAKANENKDSGFFTSPKMLLRGLSRQMEHLKAGDTLEPWWADGFGWAQANRPEKVSQMLDGAFGSRHYKTISKQSMEQYLQKDIHSSVTRLERFISCPFSYFAEYTLRAKERPVYGLKPMDMGNIYHRVLEELSKELPRRGLSWESIDDAQGQALAEELVAKVCDEMEIFQSSEKNKYLTKRIQRVAKRAVWALSYQIRKGSFVPKEYEVSFGEGENSLPPIVVELAEGYRFVFRGRIDRVDIYDQNGKRFVKIIDYKSGRKEFNLQEAYYGLQIQLTRYLAAYLDSAEDYRPAGMFYFRISDPVITEPGELSADEATANEQRAEELLEALKLSGLVVSDSDIIQAMHNGLAVKEKSNIIPVRLKKDGAPYDSSSAASMAQFYGLLKRTETVIREAGNRLIDGDIEARPVRGVGQTPCVYCGFGAICGFDVDNGYRYQDLKKHANKELLALLEDDGE